MSQDFGKELINLCAAAAQPIAGLPVGIVELPLEQREYKEQRFYYATQLGDLIVCID